MSRDQATREEMVAIITDAQPAVVRDTVLGIMPARLVGRKRVSLAAKVGGDADMSPLDWLAVHVYQPNNQGQLGIAIGRPIAASQGIPAEGKHNQNPDCRRQSRLHAFVSDCPMGVLPGTTFSPLAPFYVHAILAATLGSNLAAKQIAPKASLKPDKMFGIVRPPIAQLGRAVEGQKQGNCGKRRPRLQASCNSSSAGRCRRR